MGEHYRDQPRLGQVIKQMRILGNNLNELREEIATLRNSIFGENAEILFKSNSKGSRSSMANILQKVKKYARQVTSVNSLKRRTKDKNGAKAHYSCTNLDPTLPSILNYMFRMTEKGLLQMPTRINYFKCQANQTNEELQHQNITEKNRTLEMHARNIQDVHRRGSILANSANKRRDKIFPKTDSSSFRKYSEISCESNIQMDHPIFSPSTTEINIFPDSCVIKNYSQDIGVRFLNSNDKETATTSTQASIGKYRHKSKTPNSHARNPHFYISKVKNTVNAKRIVRNANMSTFTIHGRVSSIRRGQYLGKDSCKRCKRNRNALRYSDDRAAASRESLFTERNDRGIEKSFTREENYQKISLVELPNSSSSSTSANLETNVSDNSNRTDEFPKHGRPRTYLIRETTQDDNGNWLEDFEKTVLYMGQTSNLILPSRSFSNQDIPCN